MGQLSRSPTAEKQICSVQNKQNKKHALWLKAGFQSYVESVSESEASVAFANTIPGYPKPQKKHLKIGRKKKKTPPKKKNT